MDWKQITTSHNHQEKEEEPHVRTAGISWASGGLNPFSPAIVTSAV